MNYFFNHLNEYFGLFYVPFLFVFALDFFVIFIKNKNKKVLYRARLFFGTIFLLTLTILILFLKLYFSNKLSKNTIITYSIIDLNLGYFIAFLATIIFEHFRLNTIWILLGLILFICSFFLIGKEIIRFFRYLNFQNKKIKALKLEKALIEKQIANKEFLEKEKEKAYKEEKIETDLAIKEKMEEAFKNKTLPIFKEKEKNETIKNKISIDSEKDFI